MHVFRAVAALAMTAALVAGCGDGDPKDPPTEEPTHGTTATDEPTADPLTDPPENETARQFLRRFVALDDQMVTTGKTESYLAVTGPDCRSCREHAQWVEKIYERGGEVIAKPPKIIRITREGRGQWSYVIETEPSSYSESAGASPQEFSGGQTEYVAYIARVNDSWVVGALTRRN